MTLECPICKSPAQEAPRTGDATGYSCPTHGNFKVANTVFAKEVAEDYTREEWEAPEEEVWPLIPDDFR